MDALPVDPNDPRVKEYLALVRLQVLTPLSVLINIATVLICSTIVNPSISQVARMYPTSISPNIYVIAIYVVLLFAGQVGYCILLILARKPETKNTLVKGVGLALILSNWVMAFWAVSWVFHWFLVATLLQGLLLLLLIYANVVLLVYHRPTTKRPLDMALIHAPMRFFLILPLYLLFPYSLFIKLHLVYQTNDGIPINYGDYAWSGFGVVLGTNLLGLLIIVIRRDFIWCIAATWIAISIWSKRPKPAPVYITVLLFTVLHPISLLASIIYNKFYGTGRIALPVDEAEQPRQESPGGRSREIDTEAVWG